MRPFLLSLMLLCTPVLPALAQAPQPNEASTAATGGQSATGAETSATTADTAGPSASPQQGTSATSSGTTAAPTPTAGPAPTVVPAQAKPVDGASATAQGAANEVPTVALLDFEFNAAGKEQAPGVTSLLASEIAESPRIRLITQRDVGILIGLEKQREIFKETDSCGEACMSQLSGAVGARYVIAGRLDRFGKTFVLTANLFDSRAAVSLAKPHATADSDADLPAATRQVAQALLSRLVTTISTTTGVGERTVMNKKMLLALKGGSNFISNLRALSPSADLEVGYRFHREWIGFIQIGVAFVSAETQSGNRLGLNVVPSVLGARHLYQVESALQPYWGLGLGIQLAFGDFGFFNRSGLLPTVIGFGGLQYLFTDSFGALVELKTDLAQATLGIATGQGVGLHLDLSLGLVYRF